MLQYCMLYATTIRLFRKNYDCTDDHLRLPLFSIGYPEQPRIHRQFVSILLITWCIHVNNRKTRGLFVVFYPYSTLIHRSIIFFSFTGRLNLCVFVSLRSPARIDVRDMSYLSYYVISPSHPNRNAARMEEKNIPRITLCLVPLNAKKTRVWMRAREFVVNFL